MSQQQNCHNALLCLPAQACYHGGDGRQAKELSAKGKEMRDLYYEAKERASQAGFVKSNGAISNKCAAATLIFCHAVGCALHCDRIFSTLLTHPLHRMDACDQPLAMNARSEGQTKALHTAHGTPLTHRACNFCAAGSFWTCMTCWWFTMQELKRSASLQIARPIRV